MLERTTKKSLKQLSEREKKDLIAREGKKYWEKMTQALPDRTFRIWKVLDKSFSKYHDLLQSRQKLINETGELHNQNEELKNLLNQYIRINHELIIPPTKLMEKEG
jgi:dynein regulatry complex protein 1